MAELDREILRHFAQNMVPLDGADTSKYVYSAEYSGVNGIYLSQAKALGWEMVRGDMPENPDLRDAAGRCAIGDTILFRMTKERYARLEQTRLALASEQRGELTEEQERKKIDERISRLVGREVSVSFKFRDRRELANRRGE